MSVRARWGMAVLLAGCSETPSVMPPPVLDAGTMKKDAAVDDLGDGTLDVVPVDVVSDRVEDDVPPLPAPRVLSETACRSAPALDLSWSSNGQLVTWIDCSNGESRGHVMVFNLDTSVLVDVTGGPTYVARAGSGTSSLLSDDGALVAWRGETGWFVRRSNGAGSIGRLEGVSGQRNAFSPDHRYFLSVTDAASLTDNNRIVIADTETGAVREAFTQVSQGRLLGFGFRNAQGRGETATRLVWRPAFTANGSALLFTAPTMPGGVVALRSLPLAGGSERVFAGMGDPLVESVSETGLLGVTAGALVTDVRVASLAFADGRVAPLLASDAMAPQSLVALTGDAVYFRAGGALGRRRLDASQSERLEGPSGLLSWALPGGRLLRADNQEPVYRDAPGQTAPTMLYDNALRRNLSVAIAGDEVWLLAEGVGLLRASASATRAELVDQDALSEPVVDGASATVVYRSGQGLRVVRTGSTRWQRLSGAFANGMPRRVWPVPGRMAVTEQVATSAELMQVTLYRTTPEG